MLGSVLVHAVNLRGGVSPTGISEMVAGVGLKPEVRLKVYMGIAEWPKKT